MTATASQPPLRQGASSLADRQPACQRKGAVHLHAGDRDPAADREDEAYIHFVGVSPARRGQGVARRLYERFFEQVRAEGRCRVRAVTSPANKGSIAFHRSMGFKAEEAEDGLLVYRDYDGPGQDRVCFCLHWP